MISYDEFKEMCISSTGYAYHRPFICKGSIEKANIFLVGINPATPISSNEMTLDDYVRLVMSYENFINYYKQKRINNNKPEFSKTRVGINSFVDWINENTGFSVVETDIITYPTKSVDELRPIPKEIKTKGMKNFLFLLNRMQPKLIILYGKKTVKYFNRLSKLELKSNLPVINKQLSIVDIEKNKLLGEVIYNDGSKGKVIGCRHFRQYGKDGKTFSLFRSNVIESLELFK
ncbi:hypothetical protein JCM14036_16670 [Desulfotomaculum defluvii]